MSDDAKGILVFTIFIVGIASVIWWGIHDSKQRRIALKQAAIDSQNAPHSFLEALKGQHHLQQLGEDKITTGEIRGHIGGAFFIFLGGLNGTVEGKLDQSWVVMFSWEYKHPDLGPIFILDRLPFDDLVVQFADVETPTIEFHYSPFIRRSYYNDGKYDEVYCDETFRTDQYNIKILQFCKRFRVNAILRCKPEHWPKNISLPMQRGK